MTPEPLADRIQKLTNSTTRTNGMTIEPGFSETGFFVHTATVSAVFYVRSDVALAARSSDRAAADAAWDVIKAAAAAKIESLNN